MTIFDQIRIEYTQLATATHLPSLDADKSAEHFDNRYSALAEKARSTPAQSVEELAAKIRAFIEIDGDFIDDDDMLWLGSILEDAERLAGGAS